MLDVLKGDNRVTSHISSEKLDDLFAPMSYQGASQQLIDRLLASLTP